MCLVRGRGDVVVAIMLVLLFCGMARGVVGLENCENHSNPFFVAFAKHENIYVRRCTFGMNTNVRGEGRV